MRKNIKIKRALEFIAVCIKSFITVESNLFANDEYKENIGTIYKGSIKESNKMLRFKERFKMQNQYAYSYAIESMGR